MFKSSVTEIGGSAISKKDPLIILFGEEATEELRKVSVIHTVQTEANQIDLDQAQTVSFDDQVYTIEEVGSLANKNFNSIGHVTLNFSEAPDEKDHRIENAIYLAPHTLPVLKVGTKISIS